MVYRGPVGLGVLVDEEVLVDEDEEEAYGSCSRSSRGSVEEDGEGFPVVEDDDADDEALADAAREDE